MTLLRTVEERYQPENIQPADRLNLNLRLEYEAMAIYTEDLRHLAEDALNATIPPGFIPIQDTFRMENINNPKLNQDNNANWILSANRQLEAKIIEPLARQVTLGLEPEQAKKQLLQSLPLSRNPDILLTPSWWPRVPILPFRIMIVNANSNQ